MANAPLGVGIQRTIRVAGVASQATQFDLGQADQKGLQLVLRVRREWRAWVAFDECLQDGRIFGVLDRVPLSPCLYLLLLGDLLCGLQAALRIRRERRARVAFDECLQRGAIV